VYQLTAEDRELQRRARAFVDDLIPYEEEAEANGGHLPPDVDAKMRSRARDEGLVATNMPQDLGGGGCSMLQQVLVQEQVGRATNALAWMLSTPPQWWVPVATELQRERWLRPTVKGEACECYAITEERAGSDVSAIEATARREGDDYVLDGVKWHVTSYNEATYAFFEGRLTDGPHAGDHAMFVVDLPSPGVRVVRTPAYSHTIAHHHPIVAFEGVRVPASHRVGDEGGGMAYAYEWFRFERFMVAARCLGAAERLIDEATRFARDRVVSGSPILEFQLVQAMLADSATELFAGRSMLYEAARGVDEARDRKIQHGQASMAKLFASEMANRVADRAVQIFGGRGYMRENVAERFFRELRVERIWEGTSEIQRVIVAAQLAKRGIEALA
jgi:acyl-CoA dehydrogenase